MAHALQDTGTEMHMKVSLACFKERNTDARRLAIEKLDGYEVRNKISR